MPKIPSNCCNLFSLRVSILLSLFVCEIKLPLICILDLDTEFPRPRRNSINGIQCPSDVSVNECYHELMGVWMRMLMNRKRRI